MMTEENIIGRTIHLSHGRVVFVGEDQDETPERVKYIGFKNAEGQDTKLILSPEAYEAFKTLMTDPMAGMPLREFPHRMQWTVVKVDERKNRASD